jgi:adenine-specific DNA-methyltransferase
MIRSELDVLLDKIEDSALRGELRSQIDRLKQRRSFGLVFEQHIPERVRLPQHPIRVGAQVVGRDDDDSPTWEVVAVDDGIATLVQVRDAEGAYPERGEHEVAGHKRAPLESLVVISDFGEPVLPGFRHLGSIERGGDKPYHIVIKGENHHALEALRFSHGGRVDCIYIDPPYNSGARDWKYNNDYVDENDDYRHSKWLAFMERRLKLAKELLNPEDSVLIVTIDEKEYLRLGLLLEQTFGGARLQMVSSTISPRGTSRENEFSRVDEYLFYVFLGEAGITAPTGTGDDAEVRWPYLRRTSMNSTRDKGRPKQFYPIYVDSTGDSGPFVAKIGEPISRDVDRHSLPDEPGLVTLWPVNPDGVEMTWGMVPQTLQRTIDGGFARVSEGHAANAPYVVAYLTTDAQERVATGEYVVTGLRPDGSKIVTIPGGRASKPTTAWRDTSHDAGAYGTGILRSLIPGRRFPFPKSLYAVEDALRFVVKAKPHAVVVDFFAGSGTTAHAVARLNRQDGGRRQSIMITNNEVSVDEASQLRRRGLRPGDPEWEALGIFELITRPRVMAAITGRTPEHAPIVGDYKFIDAFPMADGFEENVSFFELRYLDADDVDLGVAFDEISALLWLRGGAQGAIAGRSSVGGLRMPYVWTRAYGILFDEDCWRRFVSERPDSASAAFILTYSATTFAGIAAELPPGMDIVRLPDSYLSMFLPDRGRA